MNQMEPPVLSVVVAIVSDTTGPRADVSHLEGNLEALSRQIDPPPVEIVVPYHARVEGVEKLKLRFPKVAFIRVDDLKTYSGKGGSREHHDELRARGLALARGEIIGLLEDHGLPDPNWCAGLIKAHQQSYAAVGGAIENGVDSPLNWAVYFCDFYRYQNPVTDGDSPFVSDANVSYKRSVLESIRSRWEETFHETTVNEALTSRGEKLALSSKLVVYQHRRNLKLWSALKERYIWGRSYALTRSGLVGRIKTLVYGAASLMLPGILVLRITFSVLKKGRCVGSFLKAFPLIAILTSAWSLGELTGYLSMMRQAKNR
jgi:hypothetical protein